ncbi:MAG TPA: pilus assembly protein PilN [Candidatus Tenderia electrophaga]|uniref:Pilus assembly protein PilN n=1 Tax=Candidatus Tenderia electrophaga TaxID=1748243 RepID=A0A832J621_9GAMM|nr:pilus assembly protein PilN [Candidatus Tenderia electrophaga]
MTRINLLPWREALRNERKRQFTSIVVGAALLMLAIIGYVYVYISGNINDQNLRNSFLEAEIAKVDERIKEIKELETKKKQLLNRMDVIQNLQTRRPMVVHMLDKLVLALPDGLYLTKFQQVGVELSIEGLAQSNARVSAFMRNLDESEWFDSPRLEVIEVKEKNGSRSSKFTLKVKQLTPEEIEAKKAEESK